MKTKITLILLMIMGSIYGIKAQTFDFSCDNFIEGSFNSLVGSPFPWATGDIAKLQAVGFTIVEGASIATQSDVAINRHSGGYTIGTPGRAGASARSYLYIDDAIPYAVSILPLPTAEEIRAGQNLMLENVGFTADARGDYYRARTQNQSGLNNPNFEDQYGVTFRYFNNGTFSVNTRPSSLGKSKTFPPIQFNSALAYALSLETVSAAEDSRLTSAGIPRIQNAYANPNLEIVYQVNLSQVVEEFLTVSFNANNETILVIDGRLSNTNPAGVVYTFRRGRTYPSGDGVAISAFEAAFDRADRILN